MHHDWSRRKNSLTDDFPINTRFYASDGVIIREAYTVVNDNRLLVGRSHRTAPEHAVVL